MTIYFVETEGPEEDLFANAFGDCELSIVSLLDVVEPDAEVMSMFIHSKIDRAFLDSHPKLKLIAIRSSGYDHADVGECEKRNVAVCFTPSCSDQTVSKHAFALILALAQRTGEALDACKRGRFSYAETRGFDVRGKTLGVIGTGRVGSHVIRFGKAFGMRVIAHDIRPQYGLEEKLGFCYASLDELLRGSHIISMHVPLTAKTYHLLNREAFQKCRRGVIIVDTTRGRLIDTDALTEALDAGVVGGAGLDLIEEVRVMTRDWNKIAAERIIERLQSGAATADVNSLDPERGGELGGLIRSQGLIARPNVVFTTHIGFNSVEAVAGINEAAIRNIRAFLGGGPSVVPGEPSGKELTIGSRGCIMRSPQNAPSSRQKRRESSHTRINHA